MQQAQGAVSGHSHSITSPVRTDLGFNKESGVCVQICHPETQWDFVSLNFFFFEIEFTELLS